MVGDEDPGFCLLGARMLLHHVTELRRCSIAAREMDVEGVHQMRVASRRIRAGLPIFRSCIKRSHYERWRQGMKGLTLALGEARDADVQIEYLRDLLDRSDERLKPGIGLLLKNKEGQRQRLQDQVHSWLDDMEARGIVQEMEEWFTRMVERLEGMNSNVRGRTSYTIGKAHTSLRVNEMLELEPCVEEPQAKTEHHQLRIAAKRLRYTLEAFRPLFDDELGDEVRALKQVQDLLGEMHDCDVWIDGMEAWRRDLTAPDGSSEGTIASGLEAVRSDRSRERQTLYSKFVARWRELRHQQFFEQLPLRFQVGPSNERSLTQGTERRRAARLAIVSDVHGNLDALNAVLEDAREQEVDGFVNLGDMVGSGAYPEEVVRVLSDDRFLGVIGNVDRDVLEFARSPPRPKARSVKKAILAASVKDLSEESLRFISSLPVELRLEIGGKRILMVHDSPGGHDEPLGPDTADERLRELGRIADADIVLVGHSHRAFFRDVDGVLFVNPGSVGLPLDGDPRASYAILEALHGKVTLRRVAYDIEAAVEALRSKGLPPEVGEGLRRGISGRDVRRERASVTEERGQAIGKVREIARVMNLDHPHAENVLRLADSLFQQLAPLHGLGERDRSLLEAGCLLHDVGTMEGMKGHHRSSYRLILEMDLPLTKEDRHMVACLARYHRKRPPREDDPELRPLNDKARRRLQVLASILRVADGLDYRHDGAVKEVECIIGPEEVVLKIISSLEELSSEDLNLTKADLFEKTFGRKVRVE